MQNTENMLEIFRHELIGVSRETKYHSIQR